jgi:hypothetical protein
MIMMMSAGLQQGRTAFPTLAFVHVHPDFKAPYGGRHQIGIGGRLKFSMPAQYHRNRQLRFGGESPDLPYSGTSLRNSPSHGS